MLAWIIVAMIITAPKRFVGWLHDKFVKLLYWIVEKIRRAL